ncbi:hypothetical protein DQ04_04041090 [Trypanosoma grayi]|uniref:hypothetical protein n=1 Tax=Trypanosoma grayi TaxID=71804 RepID=UPI0004F4A535|nr:hypothetical protein DQ04_04041090 [Trypanosoma grayi]KEG10217.1 hypothetical protein DQ04_04041090 [Trypanosoma grayi]
MGGDGQALSNKRKLLDGSKVFLTAEELRTEECRESDVSRREKERRAQQWAHCALSLEPLEAPVVFDLRGRLYSKRVVLNEILKRRNRPTSAEKDTNEDGVITRLADVREISNIEEAEKVHIRCPLTGFDASSGLHKFVGFWECGHVVCSLSYSSEPMNALNAAKGSPPADEQTAASCPFCGESSFAVPLALGREEEEEAQYRRLRPLQRAFRKRKRPRD